MDSDEVVRCAIRLAKESETMEKVYSRPESLDISNNKFCPGCMHSTFIKICMQVIDELGMGTGRWSSSP